MNVLPAGVKICLFYSLGIVLAHWLPLSTDWLILLTGYVLVMVLLSIVLPRFRRAFSIFLLLLLMMCGGSLYLAKTSLIPQNSITYFCDLKEKIELQGRITNEPEIQSRLRRLPFWHELADSTPYLRVEIHKLLVAADSVRINGVPFSAHGTVQVSVQDPGQRFRQGEGVWVYGRLSFPTELRNPGNFDYHRFLELQQIHGLMSVWDAADWRITGYRRPPIFFRWLVLPLRHHFLEVIDTTLLGPPGAFIKGILLGERGSIPPEIKTAFSDTGVIHVLAISGLHVGLIAALIFGLLALFRIPRTGCALITIAMLMIYIFLTGGSPPVVRASIMGSIILLGPIFLRRPNVYNSLAIAALIILLIKPSDLFYVGFQMSFGATLGIVYLVPKLQEWLPARWLKPEEPVAIGQRFRRWLSLFMLVSLAAQLGTVPMTVLYFNRLPIISLLANIIVVPAMSLILGLALMAVILGALSPFFHTPLMAVNGVLIEWLVALVDLLAMVPYGNLHLATPSLASLFLFILLMVFLARVKFSVRSRKLSLIVGLLLLNVVLWQNLSAHFQEECRITFLDVDQGDATLIEGPQGKTILIDGGDFENDFSYGERVIAPVLRHKGIHRLDCVVMTHPHDDHLGGLLYIVENFDIGLILDPGLPFTSERYQEFLKIIERRQIPYQVARAGDAIEGLEPLRVHILHPSAEYAERHFSAHDFNVNNSSIVLRLTYHDFSMVLTGDLEEDAEPELFDDDLKCSILKAGHHGSITSSSMEFVHRTLPYLTVVPCGRENKFHHPSEEVLRRYRSVGARVFRADQTGAVIITTDGATFAVETMLQPRSGR